METFENVSTRAEQIFEDGTKRIENIVTEKSNLIVDYVGKFINQMDANANPTAELTVSRSIISLDGLTDCEKMSIDVEHCIPYIGYLENKQRQLLGLSNALDQITQYFATALRTCDNVMSKHRCQQLMVSR
jgi:hypothetical protein